MRKTRTAIVVSAALLALGVTGCTSAADKGNSNLDKAAENFEVPRRIVGINGITDTVLFEVEGFCSLENGDGNFHATCKQPDGSLTRTTLGLSDNVTYVSTQLGGVDVDLFRSRVIFRPENVVPNFDLSTKANPSE